MDKQGIVKFTTLLLFATRVRAMKKKHTEPMVSASASSVPSESMTALAHGLSDDFNNILTVILGACSLIEMNADVNGELTRSVSLIRASAEHAAVLADRLARMNS